MTFRPFTENRVLIKNSITLRSSGTIFISYSILNKIFDGRPSGVNILIDEDRKIVGLKFLNDFLSSVAQCKKPFYEKSGISISILPVLKYFGLKPVKTHFKVEKEDDLVILDLNKLKQL